ncbi:epoxide hydrolase family protein [Desertihabitans aurantiacus]|uniref:epoxide hydrolase family protein n=1 Tax=Desertihabitans aurantiacus TaxID=2282477 RepID=UPI000DF82EBF|nr:epoxide hydrolase family protein [Desertihabitans aurantiacus]
MSVVSALPEVPEPVLADLRARLRAYRPVTTAGEQGWDRGVDPDYLAALLRYWADGYDWRAHEERIRSLPWVDLDTGPTPLRVVHQRADADDAPTVVLLHGWPDSVLRFERVLPLLTDVDVVVPALPGFPFARAVPQGGLPAAAMAEVVGRALEQLGVSRYVVSAGDVGSNVAESLATDRPAAVAALHLTDVSQYRYLANPPTELSEREQAYLRAGHEWQASEGAYMHQQGTRPRTLAVGLGDSPAGLAAWILEKLRSWTDCHGDVESVFTRDEILTWITAYWVSGCIGTSFTPYVDKTGRPAGQITAPTAFTLFPRDLANAPREFAERFHDVRSWEEPPAGGHFAAWERPEDYVRGVRTALELAAQD